MLYFDEPVGRVKIQTTSKILSDTTQQNVLQEISYPTRRIVMFVRANFADIYLRGKRNRSMRSGTELAREIQLTGWSTVGEQGKLVFLWFRPSHHWRNFMISLFTTGKNRLSIVQIMHKFKFFSLRFLSRKNVKKKFVLTNKNFFRNLDPIRRLHVARKPV